MTSCRFSLHFPQKSPNSLPKIVPECTRAVPEPIPRTGTRIDDGEMENRKGANGVFRGQLRPDLPRRHKKRVSDKIANPYKFWSEREDSNLRHLGPKPSALPGCATLRRTALVPW